MDLRYFFLNIDPRVTELQIHDFFGKIKDKVYRAKGILQLNEAKLNCQLASKQVNITSSCNSATALYIWYSSDIILESEILEIYRYTVPQELWLP